MSRRARMGAAVLALGAIGAFTAGPVSADGPVWYVKGVELRAGETKAYASEQRGTKVLHTKIGGVEAEIECGAEKDKGELLGGVPGKDTLTEAAYTDCRVVEPPGCTVVEPIVLAASESSPVRGTLVWKDATSGKTRLLLRPREGTKELASITIEGKACRSSGAATVEGQVLTDVEPAPAGFAERGPPLPCPPARTYWTENAPARIEQTLTEPLPIFDESAESCVATDTKSSSEETNADSTAEETQGLPAQAGFEGPWWAASALNPNSASKSEGDGLTASTDKDGLAVEIGGAVISCEKGDGTGEVGARRTETGTAEFEVTLTGCAVAGIPGCVVTSTDGTGGPLPNSGEILIGARGDLVWPGNVKQRKTGALLFEGDLDRDATPGVLTTVSIEGAATSCPASLRRTVSVTGRLVGRLEREIGETTYASLEPREKVKALVLGFSTPVQEVERWDTGKDRYAAERAELTLDGGAEPAAVRGILKLE